VSSKKREDVFVHAKEAGIFADHFRMLRKKKGLTQNDLAIEANVDVTTIARIEAGRQNITLDTIFGLSKALGIMPQELFAFEVESSTP
jgi:transcriptional regulator with XRE-family HTH domain